MRREFEAKEKEKALGGSEKPDLDAKPANVIRDLHCSEKLIKEQAEEEMKKRVMGSAYKKNVLGDLAAGKT